MALDPWYKVVTLRKEVREGRSFSPDEFAIALEQIVAQTARPRRRLRRQCLGPCGGPRDALDRLSTPTGG